MTGFSRSSVLSLPRTPPTDPPPSTTTTSTTVPAFPESYCLDTPASSMMPTDGNLCLIQHDVEQLRVSVTFALWLLVACAIATLALMILRRRS